MKRKKRLLFLILLIGIIFIPTRTFASVPVDIQIPPMEIDNHFYDMINGSFVDSHGGANYNISLDLHNDTDDVVVLQDTKIKKNKNYTLNVRLDITEGTIPEDFMANLILYNRSDFYVSKTDAVKTDTSYAFKLKYSTRVDKKKVYGPISTDKFIKPVVGNKIKYDAINDDDSTKYSIVQKWYKKGSSNPLTTNDTFEEGQEYEYRLEIVANEGYTLSDFLVINDHSIRNTGFYTNSEETSRTNKKIVTVYSYNTTMNPNTIYGIIDLETPNITLGQEIKNVVSKDERYRIEGTWRYYDTATWVYQECVEGQKFEAGKNYDYHFRVVANDGYQLDSNIEIIMNDFPQTTTANFNTDGYGWGYISVNFSNYEIYGIYANTYDASPKLGKKPRELKKYSYTDGEENRWEITHQQWYVGETPMGANDVFSQNNAYRLEVTYNTVGDYVFNNNAQHTTQQFESDFFVGGQIISATNKEITIGYDFNIQLKENYIYQSSDLNVAAPTINATPTLASFISTDYHIDNQNWYNVTDHKQMTNSDKFEKDKVYRYNLKLKTSDPKKFSMEFEIAAPNFDNCKYYDKNHRLDRLEGIGGDVIGPGSTIYNYSATFVMSDYLNDDNYIMGYVNIGSFMNSPKAGEHINYTTIDSEEYLVEEYNDIGLKVEKGWYEKGNDKILSTNDIFNTNKSYEFHIKYSSIGNKKIVPKAIVYNNHNYNTHSQSPYYKGIRRIDKEKYTEFIIEFEMPGVTYANDESIIKSVELGELNEAIVGGKVLYTIPAQNEKYTISEGWYEIDYSQAIYDIDGNILNKGDKLAAETTFVQNKNYQHEIIITRKNNYTFSDDTIINYEVSNSNNDYCNLSEDGNKYTCQIGYNLSASYPSEKPTGILVFKKNEYQVSKKGYRIPKGINTLTLEVDKKTNEFDLEFDTYNYPDVSEYIDYEIDGNIVTITNINSLVEKYPECRYFNMEVRGDENDQYSSFYDFYNIALEDTEATVVLPTITNYEGIVDGQPHTIGVEGGSGGTIMYSLNETGPWSESKPQVQFAGVQKIYVKVEPSKGHAALLPTYGTVTLHENNNEMTITFNSNDGKNKKITQNTTIGTSTKLKKNTFTRDNYIFDKWTENANGSGRSFKDEDTATFEGNTNLYAQWKEIVPEDYDVKYQTHVQTYGWQDFVSDGIMSGTEGEAKRLEGIKIELNDEKYTGNIEYRTHIQTYGWETKFKKNGEMSGTEGEAKRLEAIEIKLTGDVADKFDVYYRVHAQTFGWLGWAKNGESAGTAAYAKRLEGIEIKLVPHGGGVAGYGELEAFKDRLAPETVTLNKTALEMDIDDIVQLEASIEPVDATNKTITWTSSDSNIATVENGQVVAKAEGTATITATTVNGKTATCTVNVLHPVLKVSYRTHVQTYGWQDFVSNGKMSGTQGEAKRLEGIEIKLKNQKLDEKFAGDIIYKTHIQTYGWEQDFKKNGTMSGTQGEAKRLEAIEINLTGEIANHYDIYYRVHAQTFGWLGWAKNGDPAGTAGLAKRLEGIEIVLVEKGGTPPVRNNQNDERAYIENK